MYFLHLDKILPVVKYMLPIDEAMYNKFPPFRSSESTFSLDPCFS